MTKYLIYIYTDEKPNEKPYKHGGNSLYVKVTETKPYDGSSKLFKMVTHTIQYPEKDSYKPSEYSIEIFDPKAHFQRYLLKYSTPFYQLESIDIFFQFSDGENRYPLILGFHQKKNQTLYYTAGFLYSYTSRWIVYLYINNNLPFNKYFPSKDLLTRLLEELGIYVTDRKKKLVITLSEKPTAPTTTYPQSGHYPKKVTVKKSDVTGVDGYEKYEHTIGLGVNTEFFYLSFKKDSLYVQQDGRYKSKPLDNVDVYFEKSGYENPVIFVFKYGNESKLYTYSEFVIDLEKGSSFIKSISKLKPFEQRNLSNTLQKETENLKKEITFKEGSSENENVSEDFEDVGDSNYKKVKFTPKVIKAEESTTFYVYKDKLITRGTKKQVDNSLTNAYEVKYILIEVYYDKNDFPLLIRFIGKLYKKYFKIKDKNGNSWIEDSTSDGSDKEIIAKLAKIESEVFKEQHSEKGTMGEAAQPGGELAARQEPGKEPREINPNPGSIETKTNWTMIGSITGGVVVVILGGSGCGGYYYYRRSLRNRVLL